MPCSFSRVRMRECEVSPVKTYTTKWPIHRRQVFNSSLACFWYIHREEWLHTSIWQMIIHSVSDHLPHFSKRMRERKGNSVPGAVVPTCSLTVNEQKGEYHQSQLSSCKLKFIKLHVSAHLQKSSHRCVCWCMRLDWQEIFLIVTPLMMTIL